MKLSLFSFPVLLLLLFLMSSTSFTSFTRPQCQHQSILQMMVIIPYRFFCVQANYCFVSFLFLPFPRIACFFVVVLSSSSLPSSLFLLLLLLLLSYYLLPYLYFMQIYVVCELVGIEIESDPCAAFSRR